MSIAYYSDNQSVLNRNGMENELLPKGETMLSSTKIRYY